MLANRNVGWRLGIAGWMLASAGCVPDVPFPTMGDAGQPHTSEEAAQDMMAASSSSLAGAEASMGTAPLSGTAVAGGPAGNGAM
ncbi:MAG: hypothetical protein OXR73_03305, partial [Myxococcales bacterium]|nr:hypothetical protein [Myxococcales bacterium]